MILSTVNGNGDKVIKGVAEKGLPERLGVKILIYILGLFFMGLGVAFSVNSNLGVSPVNSLPYVISRIINVDMGTCVTGVFCCYILMQILLLRRAFCPVQLLQIVFSALFGQMVNITKRMVGDFTLPGYPGQLTMLLISLVFIAGGVYLYIEVDLVPMPMEGLSLTLSKKFHVAFHNMKMIIDCLVVAISIGLSFLCLGNLVGIREGTVITAIVAGKAVALLRKILSPAMERICGSAVKEEAV